MARHAYDAIVVGLGAFGAATAWQLARCGARVLGLDQYSPPHALGSSHGDTRITRLAIGEGDAYVPLVARSHQIWRELEASSGAELLTITGGLWISSPRRRAETHVKDFFRRTLAAAERFGIEHEVLDAARIRGRFPQFRVADNEVGYYEPGAGFVRPEACVRAQREAALALGATLRGGERVEGYAQDGETVRVHTDRGQYEAAQVVLCAGAWITRLAPPEISRLLTVTRQVLYWFDVEDLEAHAAPRFPVWLWELQDRAQVIYGFPAVDGRGGGAKVATEQYQASIRPHHLDALDRGVDPREARDMHANLVAQHVPGLGSRLVKAVSCLYTATTDFQFLVDRHPSMPRVIIASPCSGHGFKHSAAMGEALAQMALGREPAHDLRSFSLARFSRAAQPR